MSNQFIQYDLGCGLSGVLPQAEGSVKRRADDTEVRIVNLVNVPTIWLDIKFEIWDHSCVFAQRYFHEDEGMFSSTSQRNISTCNEDMGEKSLTEEPDCTLADLTLVVDKSCRAVAQYLLPEVKLVCGEIGLPTSMKKVEVAFWKCNTVFRSWLKCVQVVLRGAFLLRGVVELELVFYDIMSTS